MQKYTNHIVEDFASSSIQSQHLNRVLNYGLRKTSIYRDDSHFWPRKSGLFEKKIKIEFHGKMRTTKTSYAGKEGNGVSVLPSTK